MNSATLLKCSEFGDEVVEIGYEFIDRFYFLESWRWWSWMPCLIEYRLRVLVEVMEAMEVILFSKLINNYQLFKMYHIKGITKLLGECMDKVLTKEVKVGVILF